MEIGFAAALFVFGLLLWTAAALSGLMRGTVLSISVLSVACGIGLAELGVVSVDPASVDLRHLVELALIVTLFSDGLVVERELLRRHWASPVRSLVVAMPITMVLLALAAHFLFGAMSWAEAFLFAAVLAPTDPVISSSVVTAQNVPARIRHALNLESGLNDGLAVPFVLFFLILSLPGGDPGAEGLKLLGEALAGAAIGGAAGYLGGGLQPRLPGGDLSEQYMGIFALGIGLAAFGFAELTIGNGLVAVFLAGVGLAAREETPEPFAAFSEYTSAIVQVIVFFAFGALIVATGYDSSLWALAAMIAFAFLIARPLAIFVAGLRSGLPVADRAFIAWFGPKGVASMLFALIVLNSQAPDRSLVFDVAAFVILGSIVAHGLTDTVAARWIAGRVSERELEAEAESEEGD